MKPAAAGGEGGGEERKLKVVLDFYLEIAVRLGNTTRTIGELMKLAPGAVLELDREVEQPADLLVNGRVVARGEIVVVEENFGVKITAIVKPADRIEPLREGGA